VDARAAADACNRELMEQGETGNLDAAKAQIASCAECLRDGLKIESAEFEVWEAWINGHRDEAERFLVPLTGTADVAEMGAAALGVDVSEELNVARV
jgi:hypothetical protein